MPSMALSQKVWRFQQTKPLEHSSITLFKRLSPLFSLEISMSIGNTGDISTRFQSVRRARYEDLGESLLFSVGGASVLRIRKYW
jgi:hypothetical protein